MITKQRYIGLRPFVNAEVRFLRSFRYNLMYQYEWNQRKTEFYDAEDDYLMRTDYNFGIDTDGKAHIPSGGRYYSGVQNNSNYTFRNQLSFDRTFRGGHVVNALMGMEFRQNNRPRLTEQLMYGYNPVTLTSERMDWESLATTGWTSAVTDRNTTLSGLATKQSIVRHRYASFYANAGYTYKYRYNITGSIRWDEADLFGLDTNDQHHPLWSVGAGWTLSSEKFMRHVAWVDFLKLRATYGINGNVDQTSTTYFVATYKTLSNPIRTTYLSYNDDDLPNPKLRWEKTATTNIGLDFRILNSRLSGNIEYYNRHASDLLVRRYMDATLGLTSRVVTTAASLSMLPGADSRSTPSSSIPAATSCGSPPPTSPHGMSRPTTSSTAGRRATPMSLAFMSTWTTACAPMPATSAPGGATATLRCGQRTM